MNQNSQVVFLTTAYLARFDGAIHLQAKVTDDEHHQPYSGSEVWKGDNIQLAFLLAGQYGKQELGLSHLDSGKSEIVSFRNPSGFDGTQAVAQMQLVTSRKGTETSYRLTIPEVAIGANSAILKQGVRFNLLINDNDGEVRDGWIQIAQELVNPRIRRNIHWCYLSSLV